MDGPRDYRTWWSKLDTKTNIISYFLYVESEEKKGANELIYKTEVAAQR